MTLSEIKNYIINYLEDIYETNESESIAYIILEDELKMSKIDLIINAENIVNESSVDRIQEILIQLEQAKPIQYILGYADFYELKFKVNEHTLIPRQETELLVYKIIELNKNRKSINILDIGTGTGCIAISLAKNLNANITAIDFSEKAIETAKQNARINNVNVKFEIFNIIKNKEQICDVNYDIIVSNPPYVTNIEKKQMQKNVLDFEPHSALFVDNDNPLEFYYAITKFAKHNLKQNGQLWFEINEQFGEETKNILKNDGFKNLQIINDLNEKNRIVSGILKPNSFSVFLLLLLLFPFLFV